MKTHGGFSEHRKTYQCWQDMKQRCLNPKAKQYPNYGGRGITVCERWLASFQSFLGDMGDKPPGKTIDRIDNERGDGPDNCRWATPAEQRVNQRSCIQLEYAGKRMTAEEWGRHLGLHPNTIRARVSKGYPIELVLTPKILKQGNTSPNRATQEGEG